MHHLRLAIIGLFGCALTAALTGCASYSTRMSSPSGPPPTVSSLGLQVNGVAPNRAMYIQFNEAMDPATINNQTITVSDSGGRAAGGAVSYDPNFQIAAFQPNPALQDGASYTLTVSTAVASAQGVHMAASYTNTFTTRATSDNSPIFVKTVMPSPNATCVAASTPITITFSEGADINTVTAANIVISGPDNATIAAKISYDVSTATVTLTPSAALPSGTITVNVSNVADAAGVKMTAPYKWTFSTACSGSGGGGTATTQYMAPLLNGQGPDAVHGKISIDTAGNTTMQLTGAPAATSYTLQFCEAVDEINASMAPPCMNLATVATDANGSATSTFKFPQSGNWAGDFALMDSAGKSAYSTSVVPNINNETFMATLLPETQTNGGIDTTLTKQDPLTSGTVTYSNGSFVFTVKGAAPNTNYSAIESENSYIGSSGSYQVATFTTDASGNGTTTAPTNGIGGDMLEVLSGAGAGFIGGFHIP